MMCAGKGKVLSKEVATRVFRNSCNAVADNMVAAAREKAESERRERERIAAEARAKAEAEKRERERIARAKAEEEELKRKYIAATNGDADAQYNLGDCYCKGLGVAKNYQEAVKWFRKAAGQNHAKAQLGLAACYFFGVRPYSSARARKVGRARSITSGLTQ